MTPDLDTLLGQISGRIQSMPAEEKAEITKIALAATKDMPWIPTVGPQAEAFHSLADILFFGGQGGGGKGLRPETPVLTPFGWRQIGQVQVGDVLCATDGTVTKVIAVHHRGVQPLYKLTFVDGSMIDCDADHVWLAWTSSEYRKIGNLPIGGEASAKKWATADIARLYAVGKHKIAIPVMSKAAAFNVAGQLKGRGNFLKRTIPPYVLGVLIGDGCITGNSASFSCADQPIADRVERELQRKISKYTKEGHAASTYRLPNDCIVGHLAALGMMGCRAEDKFIPRIYLLASPEERFALMQGLMDTDGWADKDGDTYYCTVSERLRDDVKHLARSLGAIVTTREKMPTYTHRGEKKVGQKAYTLRIKMPASERLFSLERKRSLAAASYQSMGLKLESIERCGEGETVCISVDHPNSLFITDHFLVTHNSSLLNGLAQTSHKRSLLMRRHYVDLNALIEEALTINGSRDGFNGSPPPKLRTASGKLIEFGAAAHIDDVHHWQGQPHDLLGLDEAVQFLEAQVRFLMGWVRSADENQRCRVVFASNPPVTADGQWVVGMFRPWLDPTHPNPALPGELRWFVTDPDGKDLEVSGRNDVKEWNGQAYSPMSRTFIPAALKDNPFLSRTNYKATLDALPEPLRSAVRDGNFMAARRDAANQVIPTAWVTEAKARWRSIPPLNVPMCAMGVDASGGGDDPMVIAARYDGWYAPMVVVPGKEIPLDRIGKFCAGVVVSHRRDGASVVVDMGGGYGGPIYEQLRENEIETVAWKGAEASLHRTAERKLGFYNKRSEAYWRFREALDPSQSRGSPIALPDDPELFADLTSPTFEIGTRGIQVEEKKKLCARLGRSTDKGDAVVMAWMSGLKIENVPGGWQPDQDLRNRKRRPTITKHSPTGSIRRI